MPLRLRPLCVALIIAGLSAQAHATDLMQAYELARQSDPQLAASEAQRGAQNEGVAISRAALLPQISGNATLSKSDSNSSQFSTRPNGDGTVSFGQSNSTSDTKTRNYTLDLQQSIYSRRNYTQLGASKARAMQADAQYDDASNSLIVRVADAYFNALTAIETLASSRAQERAAKRQLDQAEKRLEVGLAPITDVHEARASYDNARATAIAGANALDDAYEALAEITGQPIQNLKGLASNFQPTNDDTRTAEDWVKIALDTNPALRASEQALAAAQKDVDSARAGHLPTLSASVSYGDRSTWGMSGFNGFNFPATSSGDGTTYGLQLSVPIFSGFGTRAQVRQSLYRRDAAADQLEQQKRAIIRQTRSAYRSLISGQAEVEARRLAVVSAKAAYEAGEAGLEVGTRTIVDVLISQQQLFQAQRDFALSRNTYMVNQLRLRQAAGTIETSDLESVNRLLVADANASLDSADTN